MEALYVARPNVSLFFFFSFLLLAQLCLANIVELDDHWQKRAEASRAAARAAYIEEPEEVNHEINEEVHKALEGGIGNQTRRSLRRKYNGPCLATNPIDRCWRCDPKWTNHRKRLANCVLGFGRHTVGGKHGKYYVVTDASDYNVEDPTPGTLRHAVIQDEPLWIIFKHDMIIRLQQELIMNSDKTIDARGVNVHIAYGAGITIQYVHNIILHGLHIHDIKSASGGIIINSPHHKGMRGRSDGDGISIFGATNIWIDHISMSNCEDGLIDAVQGSTALTISNNHFTKHNDVMLLGASDSFSGDKIMQATIAFNHFGRRLIQRMPRCRWGFFHVLNNDYTHYEMYAIGGSQNPTIISQGNRFVAPHNAAAKEVTKREYTDISIWKSWKWRSDGDLMLNGAFFVESGNDPKLRYNKKDFLKAKSGTFVTRLTRFSGALVCKPNKPC